jgi:predicted alpha/beta superfamily hydrolase
MEILMNLFKANKNFIGVICLLISMTSLAEINISEETPVTIGTELVLKSSILKKEIPIKVNLPSNFSISSASHSYPVIFIVGQHGEKFFHAVSGVVKHLADVERMPETIVVSISGDIPSPDIYHKGMWGSQEQEKWPSWGELAKYHAFYKNELFPFLKMRYRANNQRTVVGISGSSFFPFHNLTQADNLFNTYVFLAASDIIGMGFSPDRTLIDDLEARLTDNLKEKPLVFFAVASNDVDKDKRYQANVNELKKRFNGVKNLPLSVNIYDNEGHYDALLKTMLDVIELKYPREYWSANYRDIVAKPGNALDNLDEHFQKLSERYGFDIFPRATRWNSVNRLGFISMHLINLNRTKEAIEVAKRYTQYHPKSWQAYESLAKALEAHNNNDEAILNVKIALKFANTDTNRERLMQYLIKLNGQPIDS